MAQDFLKITVYLTLATGIFLVCDGVWLRFKEVLAQKLLHNAWQETVRTGASVKPWPWADSWPVARLRVERLGVDHIVLEGDSGEALAFGPGRVPAGAKPGQDGNCILAGHRDTSFTFLQDLVPGDRVSLQAVTGKVYMFRVTSSSVHERTGLYLEQPDTPWLTMVTCYPFEGVRPAAEQRYVVFARAALSS